MDKLTEMVKELSEELAAMDVLRGELKSLREVSYPGVYRAQGSVLHDFYTACERIFLRIAADMDGDVPQGEHWHIELLKRMAAERGEIRPEVISENLARARRPSLGFRHFGVNRCRSSRLACSAIFSRVESSVAMASFDARYSRSPTP